MNPQLEFWRNLLGLSELTSDWFVGMCVIIINFICIIFPATLCYYYFERKLTGDLQARVGPNRAGPSGMFQPLADLIKLFQKSFITTHSFREDFWLGMLTVTLFGTIAVLPLTSRGILINADMAVFIPFWAILVSALLTVFLGFSQQTVDGWLGSLRVCAQSVSGSFPALICILCIGLEVGGYRWTEIIERQGSYPHEWLIFQSAPFLFIAFFVFMLSGLTVVGIPPLDSTISMSELSGGVIRKLNGGRLFLFKFGRFYGLFMWSIIGIVMFCGGWLLPTPLTDLLVDLELEWILYLLELTVLMIKCFALMLFIVWIAKSNPRLRIDQITDLNWKILSPLSMAALIGVIFWKGALFLF